MHGIDDKQWMAFLDGDACAEVERHLLDCTDCSEESKRFQSWQASLFEEGSRLRNGSLGDDAQVQHLLRKCLAELASSGPWTRPQATLLMRSLLEPLCGAGAARTITDLTVRRSNPDSWRVFIKNLSENVESICGSAAGLLVGRAGLSMAVESS